MEIRNVSFVEFPDKKFNLPQQASGYKANFDPDAAKKTIDKFAEKEKKFKANKDRQNEINNQLENLTKKAIQKDENEISIGSGSEIPTEVNFVKRNAEEYLEYHFKLNYWESIDPGEDLYEIQKESIQNFSSEPSKEKEFITSKKYQNIRIKINLKHRLFMNNEAFRTDAQLFGLITDTIKCLCYSELLGKSGGAKNIHYLRNAFNKSIDTFLHE